MATTFDLALAFVLRLEGADSDHPADAGGHTRYGISQRAHPDVDVSSLTLEQATEIYRVEYWLPIQGDLLPPPVALAVFDCAVNQGVIVAAGLLQQAIGVEIDGRIGTRTVAAAQRAGAEILPRFLRLRAMRYVELARSRPSQQVFLAGWLERLFHVQAAAMEDKR
jgi:lysozyme family protein